MEAIDHRREHRVGGGEAPEQKGSAPAECRARMRPGGFDARDVGPDLVAERNRPDRPAEIRRTRLPQRANPACISLASERAWARAALPFGQTGFSG